MSTEQSSGRTVAVVTLGCARNEVDSEEMAGRLGADGWQLTEDAERADVVLVNTCGFIAQAKADSIETILGAADDSRTVVAAGCLAERYGRELAAELPEVTVLGFDDYPQISARLDDAIAGRNHVAHEPRDRRLLLPLTPVDRDDVAVPGHHGGASRLLRQGVSVPVKLASGCDRRCSFCAIPRFRGAFVSRRPTHVRDEVAALAADGVREVVLVSENSTSYGKDLGDLRLLESLLPDLGATPGLLWTRVSYLQPAEMRPGLVERIGRTPGVAAYFDLSFQHASGPVLRRMRRFGDGDAFLELISRIREVAPTAGIRSNFIVGFPGETEEDLEELTDFLTAAQLDAIGVFAYSREESTEAADFDDHLDEEEVVLRTGHVHALADALMEQRAEARIGESTRLLVESVDGDVVEGRGEHQGPEDATTRLVDVTGPANVVPGDDIPVQIVGTDGVDLLARRLP